jgi:four helix bundle protein
MVKNSEIRDFDDLEIFKLAKELANFMYDLTESFPEIEKYSLITQMRRAAVSIFSNIAEGHGRFHYRENIQFTRQSRGSLSELKSQIYFSFDRGYVTEDELNLFLQKHNVLQIKLNNYINSLLKRLNNS